MRKTGLAKAIAWAHAGRAHLGLAALIALSACSPDDSARTAGLDNGSGEANAVAVANDAGKAAPSAPVAAAAVSIEREDQALDFSYAWPAAAASIPPLNAWLRAHADGQYRKAHAEADNGRVAAKRDDFPFHQYSFEQGWEVVADLPAVLVLESGGYTFTGGAHGMPFNASLIWDRAAGKRLGTGDVIDKARLTSAAHDAFCDELDSQREEKRGEKVDPKAEGGISDFNICPVMSQQEIVPMSKGKRALDTIRVIIGPYVAGPYVEGSYVIDLPVTAAMMAAVKPAYRGWFSTGAP